MGLFRKLKRHLNCSDSEAEEYYKNRFIGAYLFKRELGLSQFKKMQRDVQKAYSEYAHAVGAESMSAGRNSEDGIDFRAYAEALEDVGLVFQIKFNGQYWYFYNGD